MKSLLYNKSLKLNIVSNFIGNGWSSIISLIFVPFYIKYIGAEGYGLIGVFATLQTILSLLDSGLSTTLNKELARLSAKDGNQKQMRDMVRTLEIVYWLLAILVGIVAISISSLLANNWVHPKELSVETVQTVFLLLGASLVFQFPIGFYSGGLLGLQHHAALNFIRIFFSTLRSVGALVVLMLNSGSITAFFLWVLFVSFLNAVAIVWATWKFMPAGKEKPVFSKSELKRIWRFAAGMSGIAISSIFIMQCDRIVLSKFLSLEQFGYYSLATTLSFVLYQICNPITQSYFPKFSSIVGSSDDGNLQKAYHQGSQMVNVLLLPAALMLTVFSRELLMIWTNNQIAVDNMWQIASIFAFGTAVHGVMLIPYMLTLAKGYTKLTFYTNIIFLIFFVPAVIFSSLWYGGIGAATCWVILNILYFFIVPNIIHKKFLPGQSLNWYIEDTLKPFLIAASFIVLCKFAIPMGILGRWQKLSVLVIVGLSTILLCLLAVKEIRQTIIKSLKKKSFT